VSDASCQLGEYGVALIKNGTKLSTAGAVIQQIDWSRTLDAVSTASVNLITAGEDCCGQLGAVDHWNTDLVIFCNNPATNKDEVVWRGPVRKATFRRGSVLIEATDMLSWMQVRLLEQAFDFVSKDTVDIFEALLTYAMTKDPANIPAYTLLKYTSGVIESRKVDPEALRMTFNVVSEMLDAGLDITTYGSTIIAGTPAFGTLELKDTDVVGNVEVVKEGDDFANRVLANASRDIVGTFPPGAPSAVNGYPLVETLVSDTQLQDQASAQAAAQARYDFSSKGVRRVRAGGGLILLPSSKINAKTLIAGQLFNFQATETCYTARETMRLGRLGVTITKGQQTATIDLQPAGAFQGGATL
jgi:hypothetical protein